MRVIILNQFFYPDHSATSQLMTDLAEGLVEQGISVTALASRGRYNGGQRLSRRQEYKGTRIIRAFTTSFGKTSIAGRLCDYASFYLAATWELLVVPRHDIIMVLTTPPLIGAVALLIGRLRAMRVVSLVQDIYPDIAVALGAMSEKNPATRLLHCLNRFVLRGVDRIVVLSECMRDRIAKMAGSRLSPIDVIHNWADGEKIKPLAGGENSFSKAQGLENVFTILFSGNLGNVNEFPTVLEAARNLAARSDIAFVFIGDGAKADEIRSFAARHHLENIRVLSYQPLEALPGTLAAAQVCLVTLAEGLAGLSMPSKTYSILAAGRPILFVGDLECDVAGLVVENGCGAAVGTGEGRRLAEIIVDWAADPVAMQLRGAAARRLFESRFDRPAAISAYVECFRECVNREASRAEG